MDDRSATAAAPEPNTHAKDLASVIAALGGALLVLFGSAAPQALAGPSPEADRAPSASALPSSVDVGTGGGLATRPPPHRGPESSAPVPEQAGDSGCAITDRGLGPYAPWQPLPIGRVLVPENAPRGPYDVVVHFHGAEAARKLLAPAGLGLVLVGLDAGEGSMAYEEAFHGPGVLEATLDGVRLAVRARGGDEAGLRHVVVSSWSAGYGAVRQILLDDPWLPDAVILLDSLHASYDAGTGELGTLAEQSLEPFVALAERAARSEVQLWLTHSDIRPPGYASTTETATLLLRQTGGQRRYAGLEPFAGVTHKTRFDRGGFHVWGLSGTTKEAHCAQLRLLLPLLRDHVLPALGSS